MADMEKNEEEQKFRDRCDGTHDDLQEVMAAEFLADNLLAAVKQLSRHVDFQARSFTRYAETVVRQALEELQACVKAKHTLVTPSQMPGKFFIFIYSMIFVQ